MYEAERGLFDLRQGRAVHVVPSNVDVAPDDPGALVVAVDGLAAAALDTLRHHGPTRLAVTGERAASMGLDPSALDGDAGAVMPVSLALNGESPDEIVDLASARGSFDTDDFDLRVASAVEAGGLRLARLGRLLPAVVSAPVDPVRSERLRQTLERGAAITVTTRQIEALTTATGVRVTRVSDGPVPLAEAENARFIYFREANGVLDHVAVLIGKRDAWPDPTPVRIHSACLTGDLFGSLRCDCGEQLRGALRHFAQQGGGILLYMAQEGRDIGLANKLRAYRLQEEGLDTVEADAILGFGADERNYGAAVEILRTLDVTRVHLLTNNPDKVRALRDAGLEVAGRMPLYGTLNRHNLPYVKAKVERAGHWLHDMLAGADAALPPERRPDRRGSATSITQDGPSETPSRRE